MGEATTYTAANARMGIKAIRTSMVDA